MANKRTGMVTDLDQAVMDWLETHHIRAKDVHTWSGTGTARRGDLADLTQLTITLYVSGVDEIPRAPSTQPSGVEELRCVGCGHPTAWHEDGKCSGDYNPCSCTEVFPSTET